MKKYLKIGNPKILAIHPAHRPAAPQRYFPIGLGYVLSAMERAGIPFTLLDIDADRPSDEEIGSFLDETSFDVVLTGGLVTAYKYIKNLCRRAREKNPECVIIAGNSVATSIPEHLLNNTDADIAVMGEADETIVHLLRGISEGCNLGDIPGIVFKAEGKIVATPRRPVIKDISSIPLISWEIFDVEKYIEGARWAVPEPFPVPKDDIRAFVVNTARGCPYKCTFCYHVFVSEKYRCRSAKSVLEEIRLLQARYGVNVVSFFDELTFYSVKQAAEFVDAVLESGLKFHWYADVRSNLFTEKDSPLLERMRESGCMGLGYSLESGDKEILKAMNKRLKVEDFSRQKKALSKAGIETFTSLVFGYPQETEETIKKTLDICYDLDLYPSAGFLLPQPATPMYEYAKKSGAIADEEDYLMKLGDRQDLRVNLTKMPDEVMAKAVADGLSRISRKLGMGLEKERLLKTGTLKLSKKS